MIVLDASAVLALLFDEPGADLISGYLPDVAICSVNFSEVYAKVLKKTNSPQITSEILRHINFNVTDFTQDLAEIAGKMVFESEQYGLSLGDRACLALGKKLGLTVLTTDKIWSKLNVGVSIKLVR